MRSRPLMNALAIAGVTALALGMTAVPSQSAGTIVTAPKNTRGHCSTTTSSLTLTPATR